MVASRSKFTADARSSGGLLGFGKALLETHLLRLCARNCRLEILHWESVMKRSVYPVLVLAALSQPVYSQSVKDLFEFCQFEDTTTMYAYCAGIVYGTAFLANTHCQFAEIDPRTRPLPFLSASVPDVNINEMVQVFVDWVPRNEAMGDLLAPNGVIAAISERWPCPHTSLPR